MPQLALEVDVDMSEALALLARLKEIADPAPSIDDLLVKASAVALARHPRADGSDRDGRVEPHPRVNVGVAVTASDALVVPTIADADGKSLGAIAADSRRLVARVCDGTITLAELSGAALIVSNLGMFGIDRFSGIADPAHAAILCAGATAPRAVAVGDEVVVRPMMTLTLACDHRILPATDAAAFLADVRRGLEAPLTLAL